MMGNAIVRIGGKRMTLTERIERGELKIYTAIPKVGYCPMATEDLTELLHYAKIGDKMRWVDGKPPAFGAEERKWIIFEHLTPFTRATVYDTAVWLGRFYSEEKVKLAKRWALLPLPEPPK
jgi:hypothetical protein